MNYKPIRNLTRITATLLIAILALGTTYGILGIGPSLVQASTNPSFTVQQNVPAAGQNTFTFNDGNGIKWVAAYNGQVIKKEQLQGVMAPAGCPAAANLVLPQGDFEFKVITCVGGKNTIGTWTANWVQASATRYGPFVMANTGPGAANILIHEYLDTPLEMEAFQAGDLDMTDWAVDDANLDEWTQPGGIVNTGQVNLQKTTDLGMFELDINSFSAPDVTPNTLNCPATATMCGGTNNQALRWAMGYLTDRDTIVNVYLGGRGVGLCAPAPEGQPGALGCSQLGYPTPTGDFNPTKAIQVLYEGGWRDADADGILEYPGTGLEVTLRSYARSDDPIRDASLGDLVNKLQNIPSSFTAKGGGLVQVCPGATCRINVNHQSLPRGTLAPIVLRAIPACDAEPCTAEEIGATKDWDLYSGGWGLGFDPDTTFFLYGTLFAPIGCGGGWPAINPLNYPCNVDPAFDTLALDQAIGRTYADIVASAQATYRYGWGYDRTIGKISGTMPTVPWYAFIEEKAAWITDYGSTRAGQARGADCWRGYTGQELGTGIDNLSSLTGLYLDNCLDGASYVSYRGQKDSVLDWGFKSQIDEPNPVTSQWLWDSLLLQELLDSCLGRNTVNLVEVVPSMCYNYGEGFYQNTALGIEAAAGVYDFRDGLMFSDGTFATAEDFKFSAEYYYCYSSFFFYTSVQHIYDGDLVPNGCNGLDGLVISGADPANGVGGTAEAFFDDVGATLVQNLGFIWVLPKHVWCASWPDTVTNCAYPTPTSFPATTPTAHVGSGPYKWTACTGPDCGETLLLQHNPFYTDGTRWWDLPARISVQPDLNRDDRVDQADLDIIASPTGLMGHAATLPEYDVDFRREFVGTHATSVPIFAAGSVTLDLFGPQHTAQDVYIIQRFIMEASAKGATPAIWPPSAKTIYNYPDATKDNKVDLDDVIQVYLNQFQAVDPPAANQRYNNDVDYNGVTDLDDLITTFVRQFQRPVGWRP